VVLRHPVRQGLTGYVLVDSELPVVAAHPHPVRSIAYLDAADAELFNLDGITNTVDVVPAAGATTLDVRRELFTIPGVASAQSVIAATDAVRDAFDQFLEIVQIMVAAVLVLMLMIAFNTAAINLDARAREHATMFAFGVKVRTALRMAVIENLVVGTLATAIGIAGGLGMVWWMTQRLLTETLPEFALNVGLRPGTVAAVVLLGIGAVAAAPLLTVRRMRRMDLPGTLRLVE
jgi:putative ABC transport system permease protein